MSEYQYLEFRAVDRPLTDDELAYANEQSSRAEITRWSFTNEYNFGDFGGDEDGMLRHGYDVFLHYANFGIRTIKIRLPYGLPFAKNLLLKFIDGEILEWEPDPTGIAGTLVLEPFHEPFDSYWEFDDCLGDVIALREKLMAGDLRALYVLWLCAAVDENYDPSQTMEPPVPSGLRELDLNLDALFSFYDVDPLLIEAAANPTKSKGNQPSNAPTLPKLLTPAQRLQPWLKTLNTKHAKDYLEQLLVGDTATAKAEILTQVAEYQSNLEQPEWPTTIANRSFEELLNLTNDLREIYDAKEKKKQAAKAKRDAAKAQKQREKRMIEMVQNPNKWLAETERLAVERGLENYNAAADILADLKEAIGGAKGAQIVHQHAAQLARKHPTLKRLKSSLKKRGIAY
ncbi:MAG: hypothetical protein AAFN77_15470 [Planctomycetota bacterium]